jgi:hypothetical protein
MMDSGRRTNHRGTEGTEKTWKEKERRGRDSQERGKAD